MFEPKTMSGVSERVEKEQTVEEEDILSRSTKKYKEHHPNSVNEHDNG